MEILRSVGLRVSCTGLRMLVTQSPPPLTLPQQMATPEAPPSSPPQTVCPSLAFWPFLLLWTTAASGQRATAVPLGSRCDLPSRSTVILKRAVYVNRSVGSTPEVHGSLQIFLPVGTSGRRARPNTPPPDPRAGSQEGHDHTWIWPWAAPSSSAIGICFQNLAPLVFLSVSPGEWDGDRNISQEGWRKPGRCTPVCYQDFC